MDLGVNRRFVSDPAGLRQFDLSSTGPITQCFDDIIKHPEPHGQHYHQSLLEKEADVGSLPFSLMGTWHVREICGEVCNTAGRCAYAPIVTSWRFTHPKRDTLGYLAWKWD